MCTDVQPDECAANGGLSRGLGSTCETTDCSRESCCGDGLFVQVLGTVNTGCLDISPDICLENGFTAGGPGTACSVSGCNNEACCTLFGCVDVLAPFCRAELRGHPLGPGSDCTTLACSDIAYCSSDATCHNVEDPVLPNPGCQVDTDWPAGIVEDCSTAPCEPFEACCTFSACYDTTPSFCENGSYLPYLPGIPQGPGTSCATFDCPSVACCNPDGTCVDTRAESCFGQSQRQLWAGIAGSTCTDYECQPFEACCLLGSCIELEPSICAAIGGFPQGHDTTCLGSHCVRQVRGDLDQDGRATLKDWSVLARCFSGMDTRTPPPGCATQEFDVADIDGDGDVDEADHRWFTFGLSGPG